MPYRFLEDAPTADVGFVASGDTLDECFRAAADATLDIMLGNRSALQASERRTAHVENGAIDLALLNFLEELIYHKDTDSLLLRATRVSVVQRDGVYIIDATLEGEVIDPARHQLSADVKAVTVHRLNVRRMNGGWEATVVLDI